MNSALLVFASLCARAYVWMFFLFFSSSLRHFSNVYRCEWICLYMCMSISPCHQPQMTSRKKKIIVGYNRILCYKCLVTENAAAARNIHLYTWGQRIHTCTNAHRHAYAHICTRFRWNERHFKGKKLQTPLHNSTNLLYFSCFYGPNVKTALLYQFRLKRCTLRCVCLCRWNMHCTLQWLPQQQHFVQRNFRQFEWKFTKWRKSGVHCYYFCDGTKVIGRNERAKNLKSNFHWTFTNPCCPLADPYLVVTFILLFSVSRAEFEKSSKQKIGKYSNLNESFVF